MLHLFREENPIIPDIDSKYIIHSSKSYRKLHSDRNIQIFKEVYQYCLHRGFSITTVHADGEFQPLKSLIYSLPGVPLVNMSTENEHFPDI